MSYVGTADVSGLPELESVRRLRESGVLREAGVKGMKWGVRSSKAKASGVKASHLQSLKDLHDEAMKDIEDEKKGDNDKEMISMYKGDAKDYNKLHNMLAAGNIRGASNMLDRMDSAPRDEFDGRGIKGLGYDEEDDD